MGVVTLGYIVDSLVDGRVTDRRSLAIETVSLMTAQVEAWLAAACADAERRGLPELKPLLESLARSTAALRAADAELDVRNLPGAPSADVSTDPSRS